METAKEKYKIIEEMISRDNNLLNISKLCKVADVSRSGFYSWRKNKDKREAKEEKDQNDFELILEAYRYRGFDKGARIYTYETASHRCENEYQENTKTNEKIQFKMQYKESQSIQKNGKIYADQQYSCQFG